MNDEIPGVTQSEAERLSLIRYQLIGIGDALTAPPPVNTLAINLMQDVVEATFAAVGDRVRASVPARADFDKLFDAVAAKVGGQDEIVGLRAAAMALNNARVGFKHHGNQVPDSTLRRHHDVTQTLVRELVTTGFGIDLESVSMLLFVQHPKVREFIETAESSHRVNDLSRALTYLRAAFNLTIDDYCDRKSVDGWRSVFDIEPSGASAQHSDGLGIGKLTNGLKEWMKALDERSRLAAIGVDLSRYAYFDAVAPTTIPMHHAGRGPYVRVRFEDVTDEHYRASHSFVVDTAVRLAATDYNLRTVRVNRRNPDGYDPEFRSEEYLEQGRRNAEFRKQREAVAETNID
ncbi:hypothetical protein [Microbacterium sp. LWO13-1.2]|uniref:hypothetical protein n=1 Tax=Microbacterium sp. LWO13-1.2 TaxID=3135262 RepID=UPI0031393810